VDADWALNACWDEEILAEDLDFDIGLTGVSISDAHL
jgi:hypothetical protein